MVKVGFDGVLMVHPHETPGVPASPPHCEVAPQQAMLSSRAPRLVVCLQDKSPRA